MQAGSLLGSMQTLVAPQGSMDSTGAQAGVSVREWPPALMHSSGLSRGWHWRPSAAERVLPLTHSKRG